MSAQPGRLERFAPLTGILFAAALIASFAIGGDSPDIEDSTAQVVQFWSDNDSDQIASAALGAVAVVFLLWFLGSLRAALRSGEGANGRLSTVAFAGGFMIAVAGALSSAFQFAAADSVGDVPAGVTHSLSVLYTEFFIPFPIGLGVLMLASGLVIVRTRPLPVWLGWVALLFGILAFTPIGFFVSFGLMAWVAVVSVVLFMRTNMVTPSAT